MKLIPYPPAEELATRTDMHAQTNMLRGEMAELRGDLTSELKGEMAELRIDLTGQMSELHGDLRGEMAELRIDLTGQMSELRTELKGDMSELRSDLRGDMVALDKTLNTRFERRFSELQASTNRMIAVSLAGNTVAVVTALLM